MALYFLLTGLGLGLFAITVLGVIWAVRNGQYDDLDGPGQRLLADDRPPVPEPRPLAANPDPRNA
jgi:cbb3-type cytochrome oxidase maturation protein